MRRVERVVEEFDPFEATTLFGSLSFDNENMVLCSKCLNSNADTMTTSLLHSPSGWCLSSERGNFCVYVGAHCYPKSRALPACIINSGRQLVYKSLLSLMLSV